MKARELMTNNPECVTREDSLQRAAQVMRDHDTSSAVGYASVASPAPSERWTIRPIRAWSLPSSESPGPRPTAPPRSCSSPSHSFAA